MTRGIGAGLVACAIAVGCGGPQYYAAPPDVIPPPVNVNGAAVQIVDQRPEWEKKPFTGVVCLYHLGKVHPKDAWAQLSDETDAVVAALPQKPARVEVVVTSFQLVRSGETVPRYRDLSAGPNANPNVQSQALGRSTNGDTRDQMSSGSGVTTAGGPVAETPTNKLEMAFAPKDDPRRLLADHPAGASCSIEATVRLVYPGGGEQSVPVKTIYRAPNDSSAGYYGQALDAAARGAVIDFGRKFRAAMGLSVN
jgi:hypothetical protein